MAKFIIYDGGNQLKTQLNHHKSSKIEDVPK